MDYKKFFMSGISSEELMIKIASEGVRFIKCLCCDKLYVMDWTKKWPLQLLDISILGRFGVNVS